MARAEAYLYAKFCLDPSNRLTIITNVTYRTDRQTDRQDRQRSDSTGRTVSQTVDQKLHCDRMYSTLCIPSKFQLCFWAVNDLRLIIINSLTMGEHNWMLFEMSQRRQKWCHSNLWSHNDLYVVGQHGVRVLCEMVKICRVIEIELNKLM